MWWILSLNQKDLLFVKHLWFGEYPAFGKDFLVYVDHPSRMWVAGEDPYASKEIFVLPPANTDVDNDYYSKAQLYAYTPVVLRLFSWTSLISSQTALNIYRVMMTVFVLLSAWMSWKARLDLNINKIPLLFIIVLMLFSYPIVFAMERGNFDLVVIPFLLLSIWLFQKDRKSLDILSGIVLSVIPWLKVYPGLLVLGLIALKKWRVFTTFILSSLFIGIAYFQETLKFIDNTRSHINYMILLSNMGPDDRIWPWQHSLTECWSRLWGNTLLKNVPGFIATAIILGLLFIWVGYEIYRCPKRKLLAYPYLCWVLGLATFIPQISNDYNLFFLPMTALAVWNVRDSLIMQISLAPFLLWWQPFFLPIDGRILLLFKLLALFVLAAIIVKRSRELTR